MEKGECGGDVPAYQIPLQLIDPGILTVEATRFRAPLLKVQLDEKDAQRIACSPYRVRLYAGKGEQWSYEYHLKPAGILKAPVITLARLSQ